jgi:hypothetical protein
MKVIFLHGSGNPAYLWVQLIEYTASSNFDTEIAFMHQIQRCKWDVGNGDKV